MWINTFFKYTKLYMVEYDEIAYSVNIVSLFLVTYGAYCVFVDDFYAIDFRSHRWGSSLLGLRMLDPPLGPPST